MTMSLDPVGQTDRLSLWSFSESDRGGHLQKGPPPQRKILQDNADSSRLRLC